MDESASDVVGYGTVTRCHQHCGCATDQCIDRVVDSPVVRGRWCFLFLPRGLFVPEACHVGIERIESMDGSTTVILREKLALKTLDVLDETRAKGT